MRHDLSTGPAHPCPARSGDAGLFVWVGGNPATGPVAGLAFPRMPRSHLPVRARPRTIAGDWPAASSPALTPRRGDFLSTNPNGSSGIQIGSFKIANVAEGCLRYVLRRSYEEAHHCQCCRCDPLGDTNDADARGCGDAPTWRKGYRSALPPSRLRAVAVFPSPSRLRPLGLAPLVNWFDTAPALSGEDRTPPAPLAPATRAFFCASHGRTICPSEQQWNLRSCRPLRPAPRRDDAHIGSSPILPHGPARPQSSIQQNRGRLQRMRTNAVACAG
jgi:hypothetical protein